eukprot:gnl/TRDRNA2_/TRDRNA2_182745_c0_seq1.p1 gnl/TRDRNA2_/TRDRNA2_182745_c0~~gnl/TRDRNA2_/TRDRNA2_182745_c0_seq1.p1  ORF type:complete len:401 (+),score=84.50 gnl/TRDRNA2_/TRDRNA2_182745_c0_seq1:83-1204(+)
MTDGAGGLPSPDSEEEDDDEDYGWGPAVWDPVPERKQHKEKRRPSPPKLPELPARHLSFCGSAAWGWAPGGQVVPLDSLAAKQSLPALPRCITATGEQRGPGKLRCDSAPRPGSTWKGDSNAELRSRFDEVALDPNLKTLNMKHEFLGDPGADRLARALQRNTELKSLNLRGNYIGPWGARQLANALANREKLTAVDLGWNNLGDEGAAVMAEFVKNSPQLTKLSLDYNSIGDAGVKLLTTAISKHPGLKSLDLQGNNLINTEGVKLIKSKVLAVEKKRRIALCVHANGVEGKQGCPAITEANEKSADGRTMQRMRSRQKVASEPDLLSSSTSKGQAVAALKSRIAQQGVSKLPQIAAGRGASLPRNAQPRRR